MLKLMRKQKTSQPLLNIGNPVGEATQGDMEASTDKQMSKYQALKDVM